MSDIVMALETLKAQITTALTAAQITNASGSIFRGWPTAVELARVIAQDRGQTQITLWPLKGHRTTSYSPDDGQYITYPAPQLSVSISSNYHTLAINAAPITGDTLHAFFGIPTQDAQFGPALGTETTSQVAALIAAEVNSLGTTAVASGANVILPGPLWAYANIGGAGSMTLEVAREYRSVQCTVWAPDALVRESVGNAIISGVGGTDQPRLTMPDGNIMLCLYEDDMWWDKAESSYSTYRWDIFFDIEYPITRTVGLSQVGGFVVTESVNGLLKPTLYFGEK